MREAAACGTDEISMLWGSLLREGDISEDEATDQIPPELLLQLDDFERHRDQR